MLLQLDLWVPRDKGNSSNVLYPTAPTSTVMLKGPSAASCQHQPQAAVKAADVNASPGTGFLHAARMMVCRYAGSVQKFSSGKLVFKDCLDEIRQTLLSPAW